MLSSDIYALGISIHALSPNMRQRWGQRWRQRQRWQPGLLRKFQMKQSHIETIQAFLISWPAPQERVNSIPKA